MTRFRSAMFPLLLTATVVVVATGNKCRLEPDAGVCRAAIRRFYYNWNAGQCQEFIYGGCGGNDNRFDTQEECERACGRLTFPSPNSNCNLPKEPGRCRAYIRSFFYNPSTGKCERFVYGGCGGNANRFRTEEECNQRCAAFCQKPKDVGPCRAAIRRWFYNRDTRACDWFIYGGCQGNRNNFRSLRDCRRQCAPN